LPRFSAAFLDNFEIVEVLGRGGMGTALKARQRRLDRIVCIKVVTMVDREAHARFLQEGRCLAQVHHPRIISVFDSQVDQNVPYLVCEYVEGRSLRAILDRERTLEPRRALDLTAQVLEGLAAAHGLSVIHRDVKPENVLVTPRWEVKLADFGLALSSKLDVRRTSSGMIVGTPSYMAPEQITKKPIVPATDLYATGAVLFEMLAGRPPFVGQTPLEILNQHVGAAVPRLVELDAVIAQAREIDDVLARALAKSPSDRFSGAHEFRQALVTIAQRLGGLITGSAPADAAAPARDTMPVRPEAGRTERRDPSAPTEPGIATASATEQAHIHGPVRRREPRIRAVAALMVVSALAGAVFLRPRDEPDAAASSAPQATPSRAALVTRPGEARRLLARALELAKGRNDRAADDGTRIEDLVASAKDADPALDTLPFADELVRWSAELSRAGRFLVARRLLAQAAAQGAATERTAALDRDIARGLDRGEGRIMASLVPARAPYRVGDTFRIQLFVDQEGHASVFMLEPGAKQTRLSPGAKRSPSPPPPAVRAGAVLTLTPKMEPTWAYAFETPGRHVVYSLLTAQPLVVDVLPQAGTTDVLAAQAYLERWFASCGDLIRGRHALVVDVAAR
jgi:hypothetical protein